jgi:hypothetical protein
MAYTPTKRPYEDEANPYTATPADYELPPTTGGPAPTTGNTPPPPPPKPIVNPWDAIDNQYGNSATYTLPGRSQDEENAARRQFENERLQAQREALIDVDALTAEYNKLLGGLRGQYSTAETKQEKERLRFILADIEAQYEAGIAAISTLYAETTGLLGDKETAYRAGIEPRAQEVEGAFTSLAADAVDRNLARSEGTAQQYRGLGASAGFNPEDANTRFIESLAPIQGNYTRQMGESTASGIGFIRDISEQQGIAQQADLTRLNAVTRNSVVNAHQERVAARIASEQAAARNDRRSIQMAALAARQSALDLNAKLMNQAIGANEFIPGPNAQERYQQMLSSATSAGGSLLTPQAFAAYFNDNFGGSPPEIFRQMYASSYTAAGLDRIAQLEQNILNLVEAGIRSDEKAPGGQAPTITELRAEIARINNLLDQLNRVSPTG